MYSEKNVFMKMIEKGVPKASAQTKVARTLMEMFEECVQEEIEKRSINMEREKEKLYSLTSEDAKERYRLAKIYEEMAVVENQYDRSTYNKHLGMILAGVKENNEQDNGK